LEFVMAGLESVALHLDGMTYEVDYEEIHGCVIIRGICGQDFDGSAIHRKVRNELLDMLRVERSVP
jgi:hypothetical protein